MYAIQRKQKIQQQVVNMSTPSPSSGGGSASKRRQGSKPTPARIKSQRKVWNAILLGRDSKALARILRDLLSYFKDTLGTPVAGHLGFLKSPIRWTDRSVDLFAIYRVSVEEVWPNGIPPPPPPAPDAAVEGGDDTPVDDEPTTPVPTVMVSPRNKFLC